MTTCKIIVKETGEIKSAVYAASPSGNLRYNVDGIFYTDKKFDQKFGIIPTTPAIVWKSHVRNLFDEILQYNETTSIFKQPFQITMQILGEIAHHAETIKDEKLIGHICRLGLYAFSDPTDKKNYNHDATVYYISKTKNNCPVS